MKDKFNDGVSSTGKAKARTAPPPAAMQHRGANAHPIRRGATSGRRGRRSKFSEAQIGEAIRRSAGIYAEAARFLQAKYGQAITATSIRRSIKASPRLQRIYDHVVQSRLDYAEAQLWRRIEAGCPRSIEFYLKHRGGRLGWHAAAAHQSTEPRGRPPEAAINFDGLPIYELHKIADALEALRQAAARSSKQND